MWMLEYKKDSWWFWLVTVVLLTFGVAGAPAGFTLAILLTVVQAIYFAVKLQSVTAFPIQVRVCYLGLLLIALPEMLQWLYWIPTVGTWAQVLVGYCLMARLVSLFPWNRTERFSWSFVKRTLFSRPVQGSIKQHTAARN